jgi:hypothetical protein
MFLKNNNYIFIGLFAVIILLCAYIIYASTVFGNKEGFQYLGYPPFAGPGYFFNFPTREYPPLTFGGYDLRGPPGCPYFGRCGEAVRRGDVTTPDKRFFYDYWWPVPQFRYDKFYGANGKLHDS